MNKFGGSAAVFFVLVLFFIFGSPWYPASQLIVSGTTSDARSNMVIRWDTGNNLNGYEMHKYVLQPVPYSEGNACDISIDKRDSGIVFLKNIWIDGKKIDFGKLTQNGQVETYQELLALKGDVSNVRFSAMPVSHLRLEFLTYNYSGNIELTICGVTNQHNLYSSNDLNRWSRENVLVLDYWYVTSDGQYSISMDMPRHRVNAFRVESNSEFSVSSFQMVAEDGTSVEVTDNIPTPHGIVYQTEKIDNKRFRYFHPHRIALQVVFALLTLWFFIKLQRAVKYCRNDGGIFFGNGRFLFWGMLVTSFVVFSFWQISFWPAIMSTDSLKIWRAAHIPGMYLGDHPPLNVLFYQYLIQFWDNPAVVPLVQNFLTSLLISYIFYSCFRWKVSLLVVVPLYLLIVFSIPVALYTTVLWKDVPFALLTVYLSFVLADLYFKKRFWGNRPSLQQCGSIVLLLVMLLGFRHNGIVYFISVPLLLVVLGILKIRWKSFLVAAGLLVLVIFAGSNIRFGFLPTQYFSGQVGKYLKQMHGQLSFDSLQDNLVSYLGIFDVNQKKMQWDHLHLCFWGRYNNDFLKKARWNDIYPYLPLPRSDVQRKIASFALTVYQKSYKAPWVYFSWNPFYMLVVLLALPFMIRWLPMTAVYSIVLLTQVSALVVLDIFNWRYYYFAFLGLYFLVPLIVADVLRPKLQISD